MNTKLKNEILNYLRDPTKVFILNEKSADEINELLVYENLYWSNDSKNYLSFEELSINDLLEKIRSISYDFVFCFDVLQIYRSDSQDKEISNRHLEDLDEYINKIKRENT